MSKYLNNFLVKPNYWYKDGKVEHKAFLLNKVNDNIQVMSGKYEIAKTISLI